ncbi:MAG: NADH-quinone oxidoreductase subunit M, partial [candidate division NC10 bacterium]|nr:NADH-quinone oxidoreductase subunit M [candidate division NC10 bacterium]
MSNFPLISTVVFLPLLGVALLLLVDRRREAAIKHLTFAVSVLTFLVSLLLYRGFQLNVPGMQFVERKPWIAGLGVQYFVGVDGISLLLVLLTTFLTAIAILSSYTAITTSVKEYMICMLLLETGMLGVFVALDLVLFYVFWEGMLIPMYFLIGVWGGPRRIYATIKFFLYTMAGGVLMLVGIIALYYLNGGRPGGEYTFDLLKMYGLDLPLRTQVWLFLAFAVAFAIKVPMFPFHTWLPDAHVEAPTAGSVILAGVLLKMGTYGFLRFALPLFPEATRYFTPLFSWLAIIGILYGALVSMVQPDLKKLVAYSSVSHLGFVMLGIFALTIQGVEGGILQMINHGLSTGALFLIVGMIYERRHTRMIEDFGGLARVIPVFTAFFLIVTLSSIGLPGLNGFVGEFLILVGTFRVNVLYAVLATSCVILAAVYMLWMFQRVMFGKVTHEANRRLTDLTAREVAVLVPVLLFIVWIGIYPRPFLATTEASVKQLLAQVHIRYRADGPRGGTPPIPTESGKAGMGPRVMDASREPRAESREELTATAKRHP